MNTKIIVLLLACIFAAISTFAEAGCPDVCTLPRETGPCKARMPRWGYDPSCKECVEFIWGGCGGNGNNFKTKKECEAACPKRAAASK